MSIGSSYGGQYGAPGVPGLGTPPMSGRFGNSPTANALRNTINVFRLLPTPLDADGALTNTWTQIFTNVPCSVQVVSVDRDDRQGGPRQITAYEIMLGVNPGVLIGDQVQWTDDLGVLRIISVLGSENMAGRGVAWLLYGEEVI